MRHWIAIGLLVLLALTAFALVGCDDDVTSVPLDRSVITLQPEDLPTLKTGLVYEGWVVKIDEDSNWVDYQSFGKFFWDEYQYFFLSMDLLILLCIEWT